MAQTTLNLRVRWPIKQRLVFWLLRQWLRVGAMFPKGIVEVTIDIGAIAKEFEYRDEMRKRWRPLGE